MTRLSKKDNHILLKQEWRLLFGTGAATGTHAQAGATSAQIPNTFPSDDGPLPTLPPWYNQDTFLVKSFFSESELYYLILLTNLKQCWCEKLRIEDIRERSKATFDFGLANVHWEFKLSPMIQAAGSRQPMASSSQVEHQEDDDLLDNDGIDPSLSLGFSQPTQPIHMPTAKRTRRLLEESEDDMEDDYAMNSQQSQDNEFHPTQLIDDNSNNHSLNRKANQVDGMSMMFDHLILPLISLTNAYRKQTKGLEMVIKSKESEVVEALEMLEQCGVGYQNRRKATERYDKMRTETRLRDDIEQLVRPQMFGPKELFSDKLVPALCSIVSKNSADQDTPLSTFESGAIGFSQTQETTSSQTGRGAGPGSMAKRHGVQNLEATTLTLQRDPAAATVPAAPGAEATTTNAGGNISKSTKESEELERRRVLQEQLDKEKAEKEKARKKKKLF
ncbi:hypothetical protein BGX31_003596 [Mortierella sp. GBA43]|nr:hypothetical protein BGX31_003596 [Mortierella sp. GBA43]